MARPQAGKDIPTQKQDRERGSAMVEFLLSSLVWLPVLLGTIVFGINLIRAIQVSQLSRDTGHMYAYGIDFTQSQNAALIARMASGLGIQQDAGNGAVVLSKITVVTQKDCDSVNMSSCPNKNKYVFTSIYVFGNQTYAETQLGDPDRNYFKNGTNIQMATYLSDRTLEATNFGSLLQFAKDESGEYVPGQYAYVSEVKMNSQAIIWDSFTNTGSYARSIF